MPVPDNDSTRGKCGLKALQYMAMGLPTICSPVGVNSEMIEDGVNGFLANSEEEWRDKLTLLMENPDLRKSLGNAGRKTVLERYSMRLVASLFYCVLESVAGGDLAVGF
jgi:glycosyltransferase involved in cell wall biosynthesis